MSDSTEPDDEQYDPQDQEDLDTAATDGEFADWGGGELEAAYLKAMQALEASEAELPQIAASDVAFEREIENDFLSERPPNHTDQSPPAAKSDQALKSIAELLPEPAETEPVEAKAEVTADVRLNPRQILEACLFVGGSALASGKLAGVLRGDFDSDDIDREIDELNRLYAAECRPYEIRLGEGGYRFALRDEFERIRYKVYGLGPKEVRLSQESLEVLAIVAYHQPTKQAAVEELGKPNCGAVLRQLVRRELLAVERDPEQPRDVFYKTTTRFLSLFGIRNLDELPRHEQVGYK